jgi:hypothetical protein
MKTARDVDPVRKASALGIAYMRWLYEGNLRNVGTGFATIDVPVEGILRLIVDMQTIGLSFPENWDSVDLEEWFRELDKALGRTTPLAQPKTNS